MPICGSRMHNFCHCSQPFAQGRTSSRASLVFSLELINQDASPLMNTMDVEGTHESAPKDLEVFTLNYVLFPDHEKFSRKVLRSLIFTVWDESV